MIILKLKKILLPVGLFVIFSKSIAFAVEISDNEIRTVGEDRIEFEEDKEGKAKIIRVTPPEKENENEYDPNADFNISTEILIVP